jgi:DNA (cytosine-5)-methyltransferase 1
VTATRSTTRPGGSAPLGMVEAGLSPVIVGCGGRRGQSAPVGPEQPMPTGTAKADACLAAATLVQTGYGEREEQAPRALDVEKPLGTPVAGAVKHAAVAAMMSKFRGSNEKGGGGDLTDPAPTATAGGLHQAIVAAHLEQANGSPEGEKPLVGRSAVAPLSTIATAGSQQRLVETTLLEEGDLPPEIMVRAVRTAAFLIKYYGNEQDGHGLSEPIGTVTVQDRFAVVMVTIDAVTYVIVDIGLRMLVPRELFNAQGFPAGYIIEFDAYGKAITKTAQVAKCGNSVCPPLAEALAGANCPSNDDAEREAA